MAKDSQEKGLLFSRVYLEKGAPQNDSARFRNRIGAKIAGTYFDRSSAASFIRTELGVKVPLSSGTRATYLYEHFVNRASMRDLLDTITIIYRYIPDHDGGNERQQFRDFVDRAMREENLSYRLDELAGVHFFVDEEFERSRAATLSGLTGSQYEAARQAFEDSHRAMLASDTLGAVRLSFDAVENVFKQRFGVPRLGATELKSKLTPLTAASYNGRVSHAATRLIESFAAWTNAAHQFRHAPGDADPSPPPIELAILMMSQAAGFLRWLASPALSKNS